jgi:hypothetical protein
VSHHLVFLALDIQVEKVVKRFFILSSLPKENSSGRIASRKVLELLEMEFMELLGKVLF